MNVKHRVKCFDSELLVCEQDNAYLLTIQTSSNPLGLGNPLETFTSEEKAVEAAEHFCKVYLMAREKGYYLKEKFFTKPEKDNIEVSRLMNKQMSMEQLTLRLDS